MSIHKFDLVIIGTGSAASAVAFPCRSAGWTVAVIDARPYGGTCALRGCDPKKVLVGAAELVDWHDRMQGKGVRSDGVGIDWLELMRFKRTFTDPVPRRRERSFAEAGITTFHGRARFVGSTAVKVGPDLLQGRHVVVASGAKPASLGIPGTEYMTTSDQFLELPALPERICFVGGGYISFEFAHIAARAGAQVTILHRSARPLGHFDPDLVDQLVRRTQDLGVTVHLRTAVEGLRRTEKGLIVEAAIDGGTHCFDTDLAVHGAGRVPDIHDLDIGSAGVSGSRDGIAVNEYLQSVSNPFVYAAGDAAAGGPPLTPVAGSDGELVADNLLNGNHRKTDYTVVPSVVFTIPPLAAVGLSEAQAREQQVRFRAHYQSAAEWYSSRRIGERYADFKVLIEEETERILGAHLFGHHADETINLFALAMRGGLSARDLARTMFAYPTHGSDLQYMV